LCTERKSKVINTNVYYAPTCDITTTKCNFCSETLNLEELLGISYEDASTKTELEGTLKFFET